MTCLKISLSPLFHTEASLFLFWSNSSQWPPHFPRVNASTTCWSPVCHCPPHLTWVVTPYFLLGHPPMQLLSLFCSRSDTSGHSPMKYYPSPHAWVLTSHSEWRLQLLGLIPHFRLIPLPVHYRHLLFPATSNRLGIQLSGQGREGSGKALQRKQEKRQGGNHDCERTFFFYIIFEPGRTYCQKR